MDQQLQKLAANVGVLEKLWKDMRFEERGFVDGIEQLCNIRLGRRTCRELIDAAHRTDVYKHLRKVYKNLRKNVRKDMKAAGFAEETIQRVLTFGG